MRVCSIVLVCTLLVVQTSGHSPFTDVSGPLSDAKCDVEVQQHLSTCSHSVPTFGVQDVEHANSNQLYSILEEITNATYFRLLKVPSPPLPPHSPRPQVNMGAKCEFFNREEEAPKACDAQPAAPAMTTFMCSPTAHCACPSLLPLFRKPQAPKTACALDTSVPSAPGFMSGMSASVSDPVDTTISAVEDAVHDKVNAVAASVSC